LLPLTEERAEVFREAGMDVPVEKGLLVIEAVENSPADRAGLQGGDRVVRIGRYRIPLGGDIITALNGEPMTDLQTFTVYLETQTRVGDSVELTIIRDGEEQTVQATLDERP